MATPTHSAAFPFVSVDVDTSALARTAARSPGVVAVVGESSLDAAHDEVPTQISTIAEAAAKFDGKLLESLVTVMTQRRRPERVYAVQTAGGNANHYGSALDAILGVDDITGVALAKETRVAQLKKLRDHVQTAQSDGNKRIGYAMVDPAFAEADYPTKANAKYASLKGDLARMVLVAARLATTDDDPPEVPDVAAATMSIVHGHAPHISALLKPLNGFKIPLEAQFTKTEIEQLSSLGINPVIDPQLMPGEGLHLAEGRLYSTNSELLYIDTVRTLDDIEFRLRAGLMGMIGDARITRVGLTKVKNRIAGILERLVRASVITRFAIEIPVLEALLIPADGRSPGDDQLITEARSQRVVVIGIEVVYGPAVHRIDVTLHPSFA